MVRSKKGSHFSITNAPEVGQPTSSPDPSGIAQAIERRDESKSYAAHVQNELGGIEMPLEDELDISPDDMPDFLK